MVSDHFGVHMNVFMQGPTCRYAGTYSKNIDTAVKKNYRPSIYNKFRGKRKSCKSRILVTGVPVLIYVVFSITDW